MSDGMSKKKIPHSFLKVINNSKKYISNQLLRHIGSRNEIFTNIIYNYAICMDL